MDETYSSRSWDAVGCTQKWLFLPLPESGEHCIHCRNGLEFEIRKICRQILAQLSIYYVLRCKTRACFSLLLVALIKPTLWELHENMWFSVWQSIYYMVHVCCLFSCIWLFATPWIVAHQAPLSKGFSRQEYWSGLPCSPSGDLFDPGVKFASPISSAGFPGGSAGKESACNVGDLGSIPGLGRSPGEGKGYPFQYSGLENSLDCIVREITKSQTLLSDFHFTSSCLLHWQAGSLPLAPPGKPKFYLFIWLCNFLIAACKFLVGAYGT